MFSDNPRLARSWLSLVTRFALGRMYHGCACGGGGLSYNVLAAGTCVQQRGRHRHGVRGDARHSCEACGKSSFSRHQKVHATSCQRTVNDRAGGSPDCCDRASRAPSPTHASVGAKSRPTSATASGHRHNRLNNEQVAIDVWLVTFTQLTRLLNAHAAAGRTHRGCGGSSGGQWLRGCGRTTTAEHTLRATARREVAAHGSRPRTSRECESARTEISRSAAPQQHHPRHHCNTP